MVVKATTVSLRKSSCGKGGKSGGGAAASGSQRPNSVPIPAKTAQAVRSKPR